MILLGILFDVFVFLLVVFLIGSIIYEFVGGFNIYGIIVIVWIIIFFIGLFLIHSGNKQHDIGLLRNDFNMLKKARTKRIYGWVICGIQMALFVIFVIMGMEFPAFISSR